MSQPRRWRAGAVSSMYPPMSTASRQTFFASLRRDRLLFALLGTLVLFLHTLQPLAAAQAPEGGHLSICTLYGIDDQAAASGDAPAGPLDDCPICLIGNACSSAAAYKAAPAAFAAFPAPAALVSAPPRAALKTGPAARRDIPPPAIRAPPPSA